MSIFDFAVIASGLDHEADDFEDRLFAAGCDDATVAFMRGAIVLQFAREAETLEAAIGSALTDVRAAGATVDRVEPDYLVSISEIAERANMTRAAISLYAKGERGSNFPSPVARVTTDSPLWDWTEVAAWLEARGKLDRTTLHNAHVLRAVNDNLDILSRAESPQA